MTAYVLMATVLNASRDSGAIPTALPIVKWLTQQRNAQGGFSSTLVYTHTHPRARARARAGARTRALDISLTHQNTH